MKKIIWKNIPTNCSSCGVETFKNQCWDISDKQTKNNVLDFEFFTENNQLQFVYRVKNSTNKPQVLFPANGTSVFLDGSGINLIEVFKIYEELKSLNLIEEVDDEV